MFESLDQKDLFLHHPFESFDPVIAFVETGGRGSRRPRHQADPLPDERRFAHRAGAGPRRGERQAGHGGLRADRPLRRTVEHPVGETPRGGGRPRHLRHSRLQDPRQDLHGGSPRPVGNPPLRSPRHGQLQRQDGAPLHGLRPHHLGPHRGRGRLGLLQRSHGILGSAPNAPFGHGPHSPAGAAHAAHRSRAAAGRGRGRPPRSARA